MCKHDEWVKICVLCGDVLEDTEHKASMVASAEMNKTVYVAAQQSVQRTRLELRRTDVMRVENDPRCLASGGRRR